MSYDRIEYPGLLLTLAITAICTVVAIGFFLRHAFGAIPFGGAKHRWAIAGGAGFVAVALALSVVFQSVALSRAGADRTRPTSAFQEPVRSTEWEAWRSQIHAKLAPEPVTEEALIEALRIRLPSPPDKRTTEADFLRRDQAVADALLSYPGVREIIQKHFGIRENFLGTGLSKPLGGTPYGSASVHEYLVGNHSDSHEHVWLWKVKSFGKIFSLPLQSLIGGDKDRVEPDNRTKVSGKFEDELQEILLRVKNPDHPIPPMIRFARFDEKYYKNTLGRPEASQVFTSNLSEVWDLTLQQAAERSGYAYTDKGDTLFIWVYVPYHSNEFTPATWRQILERMPEWLEHRKR